MRAGGSVDDEGVAGAEQAHGLCSDGDEVGRVDSHDLGSGSGGIGERADQVKDRPDTEGAADGHDGFHGRMQAGCVQEREAVSAEGGCALGGSEADGDAQGFEDVG